MVMEARGRSRDGKVDSVDLEGVRSRGGDVYIAHKGEMETLNL